MGLHLSLNNRGAISAPAVLLLAAFALAQIGLLLRFGEWHGLVRIQYELNHCVGEKALDFKSTIKTLEAGNARIRVIRAALVASTLLPQARAPLEAALRVEILAQEFLRKGWEVKRVLWLAGGCAGALNFPLPALPFARDPPDAIGPRPLRWEDSQPREQAVFRFSNKKKSRNGRASVFYETQTGNWRARYGEKT